MREEDIKKFYREEWEIPPVVDEKLEEAYQKIGGRKDKAIPIAGRRLRRAVVAAACFVMLAGITVGASAGSFEGLRRLFGGTVKPIMQSSKKADAEEVINTFDDLTVDLEEISGTDELAYMIFRLKRTDGKNFQKDVNYCFGDVDMKGENDPDFSEPAESFDRVETQSVYDGGTTVENEGTDEIRIAVVYMYQFKNGKKTHYHRGDVCTISLHGLFADNEDDVTERIEMAGDMKLKFRMDYGKAAVRELMPNKKIRFPKLESDKKYILAGTLKKVTITPYDLKYTLELDKLWDSEKGEEPNGKVWEQVFLEMEDGTKIGNTKWADIVEWSTDRGRSDFVSGNMTSDDPLTYSTETEFRFRKAVDVSRITAVWFGKTRIAVPKEKK